MAPVPLMCLIALCWLGISTWALGLGAFPAVTAGHLLICFRDGSYMMNKTCIALTMANTATCSVVYHHAWHDVFRTEQLVKSYR